MYDIKNARNIFINVIQQQYLINIKLITRLDFSSDTQPYAPSSIITSIWDGNLDKQTIIASKVQRLEQQIGSAN